LKHLNVCAPIGNCEVFVGESSKLLKGFVRPGNCAVITDENVRRLYPELFFGDNVIEIGLGERIKTLKTIERIYQRFLELELDRSGLVVGIGGGVVTDIAGFSASTYMRGVPFGLIPSTLLAQVDASIGGKNGINISGYKNIVGVFNHPRFVLLDFKLLKTLPSRERKCGLAEIIKHALIKDLSLFASPEGSYHRKRHRG